MRAPPPTKLIAAAGGAGLVLSGITVAVTLAGVDGENAALAAVGRALIVLVPVAVGCYAWYRRPQQPFGLLMVAAGALWFLTTLAESDNSVLYSTGRVAAWFVELELIYLVLSFPTGRIAERLDRAIVVGVVALIATLYLPTALIDGDFPLPTPYTTCESGCPANAFFVLDSEPAFVDQVVRPVRDALAAFFFLAVTLRLAQRIRGSTRLMRSALSPVLAVAVIRFLAAALFLVARRADPGGSETQVLGWAAALGLPLMALGFFGGLLRWRLFVANALQSLGLRIHEGTDAEHLRATLADALEDPKLRLVYWAPGRHPSWVEADGRQASLPEPGSGRRLTTISDGDRALAAIIYDDALRDQEELVEAAAGYARVTLENRRLYAEVEASLEEARDSRARMVASADRERRRIERDLHDGAQQRLVALRIKLELAAEALDADPVAARARIQALGAEVEATLDEIRALAHGVYPPLLVDEGLAEALRAAARQAPVSATVRADGIGRHSPEVESAVYFCCLEALQNAAKHAGGGARVSMLLAEDDELRFEIRDDGCGFAVDTARGAGITNMKDRVAAVGGTLTIVSEPGRGVVVAGSVPVPA